MTRLIIFIVSGMLLLASGVKANELEKKRQEDIRNQNAIKNNKI